MREASALLLDTSSADALVAWLEDRERAFLWRADESREPTLEFEELPAGRASSLLARALRAVDPRLAENADREEPVVISDLRSALGGGAPRPGHALAASERTRSLILLPFEIDDSNSGVLQLEGFDAERFAGVDREKLAGMARLLGVAIANRRAQAARAERVKELACMYSIAQLGAEAGRPIDELLQRVVELLPPAWQYPAVTTARIEADGKTYLSRSFAIGPHRLSAPLRVRDEVIGQVEVFYVSPNATLENPPLLESEPFLGEEQHLIDGVARAVSTIIERKRAETERLALEEQVRHADRLATIGQLAAGVAHELNEPLANILGFAQLALRSSELAEQTRADLDAIVSASLYAREIIKKLMFFARPTPSRRVRFDLDAVVRDGVELMSARCRDAQLDVSPELGDAPRWLVGDPAQLQQVLVNLVLNAIQAMPDGGQLRIQTSELDGWVTLSVSDTGMGIAGEHVPHVFEPFFTTKDVGQGTGLGLAVVHGIVSAHGGRVDVESELGRGTRFRVILPAAEPEPDSETGN